MTVTAKLYGKFFNTLSAKDVDLDADSIKGMLCTSTYTPDQDTHEFKNSVTNEVTGAGYTAGGQALSGVTIAYNSGTNTWSMDASDLSWTTITVTARYLVLYDATPATDAARRLIAYVDFGADVSTTAGTLTITWAAAGIVTVTVS